MKVFILVCLIAFGQADFLDDLGNVVDKVGDGVVDAANTVAGGIKDAAHTVGGALENVGSTLGSTFGDVWNVVKDPLAEVGKELLLKAGEMALEQGMIMALDAMAAGKRDLPDPQALKAHLSNELLDEYQHWLQDTELQVLGSKAEMQNALTGVQHVDSVPEPMRTYLKEYAAAVSAGNTKNFVLNQASTTIKNALENLKQRLEDRLTNAVANLP